MPKGPVTGPRDFYLGLLRERSDLVRCFDVHGVMDKGRAFIEKAIKKPERRVGGGRSVCARIPSRKMRRGIQAESWSVELPFVEKCEYDPDVQFILCQPGVLHVAIRDKLGRNRPIRYVPDYLVLDGDGFALVECKPAQKLEQDVARDYPRYVQDGASWRWPAAERAAAELGLRFRVFSSGEVNPIWHRNMKYLSYYMDRDCPDEELARCVRSELSQAGSMQVHEALSLLGGEGEVLWWMMANFEVWADLQSEVLFRETSWIYATETRMVAGRSCRERISDHVLAAKGGFVRIDPGSRFKWDGVPYIVVHRKAMALLVQRDARDAEVEEILLADFDDRVRSGAICGDTSRVDEGMVRRFQSQLKNVSEKELETANRRLEAVRAYRKTGMVLAGCDARSVRRWARWAEDSLNDRGLELLGLVRPRGRPSGIWDLDTEQVEEVEKAIEDYAGDNGTETIAAAWGNMDTRCGERGIRTPSYERLRSRIQERSKAELALGREGVREERKFLGPRRVDDELAPISDRAFEFVYADHTLLDIELLSSRNRRYLGRAWLSVLIDDYSRMPLAMVLTYFAPSRATFSALILDCLSRHNRLPEYLSVDQGSDFNSKHCENVLSALDITKIERMGSDPVGGTIIERVFGNVNKRLIHKLEGNTKLAARGRSLSRSHDPKRRATHSIMWLHDVCERWFFQVYPELEHDGVETTPAEMFAHSLAYGGARTGCRVVLTHDIRMLLTLPPEGGGHTRKVDASRGIVVKHFRYWHGTFRRGDVAGTNVLVKVDPLDCSEVFAWVKGEWVTCKLFGRGVDLQGVSWKTVRLAMEERRRHRSSKKRRFEENQRTMAKFLSSLKEESQLGQQMEQDAEVRSIHQPRPEEKEAGDSRCVRDQQDAPVAAASPGKEASSSASGEESRDDNVTLERVEPYDSIRRRLGSSQSVR